MPGQAGGHSAGHRQDPESISGLSWYGLGCGDKALPAPTARSLSERGRNKAVAGGGRSLLTMSPCAPLPGVKD